jgi:hypothetical protein
VHGVLQLGDRRCSIRGSEVTGDRADAVAGGLGSPVRVGTGEAGPTNSLAGLRPRERDQRQENDEWEVLWAGRATPARNPSRGEGDSGALRQGKGNTTDQRKGTGQG